MSPRSRRDLAEPVLARSAGMPLGPPDGQIQHARLGANRPVFSRWVLPVVLAATLLVAGCGGSSSPDVPVDGSGEPDPELIVGRDVYGRHCATCHGNEGQGGRGARLNDGATVEKYPDAEAMAEVIAEGKGSGMPAFEDRLSEEERLAVARYVLEVLN